MTLTIDNLFTDSVLEFMDQGDNNQKYKDYDLINKNYVFLCHPNVVLEESLTKFPQNTELVIDFDIKLLKNTDYDCYYYISGKALIPKTNNQTNQ